MKIPQLIQWNGLLLYTDETGNVYKVTGIWQNSLQAERLHLKVIETKESK